MKPQPSHYPISDTTIGYSMSARVRGVTEVYFPSCFTDIHCEVLEFTEEIKGFRKTVVKTAFTLSGVESCFTRTYEEEEWKLMATENFFRFIEVRPPQGAIIAPIFAMMLNQSLRVEAATLKISGKQSDAFFDQSPDILIAPSSYPPLVDVPNGEGYLYYDKKSTVFYAALLPRVIYEFTIELESIGTSEFAPLFPYGKTRFKNAPKVFSSSRIQVSSAGYLELSQSKKSRLPEWLHDRLNRDVGSFAQPKIRPAHPWRGEFPAFNPLDFYSDLLDDKSISEDERLDKIMDQKAHELSHLNDRELKEFETFRPMNGLIIPEDMDFDISVRTIKKPLPTRIYDQLENLPNYQDVLIEYDLINLTRGSREIQFETEIAGITDKAQKTIVVPGLENDAGKPARTIVAHCPRLKFGILEQIVSPYRATLNAKVTDRQTGAVIFEQTYEVDLLPHDQMVWGLRDVRNSHTYNLTEFIAAWVSPTDRDGLLDGVRAGAIKYSATGALGDSTATLDDARRHAKAAYEYLAKDLGVRYLNQPFTSRNLEDSQRVVLPERVITNKAGNCIDLTVLFASILEGFGIESLIFITPDHAFVGWGNPRRTNEMAFLETTMVGTATFEEASASAAKTFNERFLFIGAEDPIPDLMSATRGCHIVDLASVRRSGIVSRR